MAKPFFINKGSEPDDDDDDEEVKSKPSTQLTGEIVKYNAHTVNLCIYLA